MTWSVNVQLRLGACDLDVALQSDNSPVALIGANGAGKSTILRTIAGAHVPQGGSIKIGEKTVFDASTGLDLPPEERGIGYLPQGFGLFPTMDVLNNVGYGLWAQKNAPCSKGDARERARQELLALGGEHLIDKAVPSLSGGEEQLVALARALVVQPKLLLLDEPLSTLDIQSRRKTREQLTQKIVSTQIPTLMVSHDARDLGALNPHIYALEAGKIVQEGSISELSQNPTNDFVAEFFASS